MLNRIQADHTTKVEIDETPKGLSQSDWASIREAYEVGRHAFQPVNGKDSHWQARNPGQQWITRFDGRGFIASPQSGEWKWGLELLSYGTGNIQTPVGSTPPQVKANGQHLSYDWNATVQEWWINDPRGLEHGYIIAERPAANSPFEIHNPKSTLNLTLATRGDLKPKITADAQGVLFQDASSATVVIYTGLKVWDACGNTLPSRFEAAGGSRVRLVVEDTGARYPVTIDPIAQQAYLKASNTAGANGNFGYSVAVSDDTIVIGAPGEDSSGAAYVFVRSGMNWIQQAYLKASNPGGGDLFGYSVAISGDTLVVGAENEDSNAMGVNGDGENNSVINAGAAYVFTRSGAIWTQQAYLKAGNTGASDNFGYSVAVSADTVVVGAPDEDSNATTVNGNGADNSASDSGAAYVFARNGTAWTQQAYLKASNSGGSDDFGYSVAVSGDTVVIGAIREDSNATMINVNPEDNSAIDSGAAYVFTRSGANWTQHAYLKASNSGAGDNFGFSVAVSGDTVVVGARLEDSAAAGVNGIPTDDSASGSGAAYVFKRSGTSWAQQAYLKASNTGVSDNFGSSVAVSGNTVVVGAYLEDSNAIGVNGNQADNTVSQSGAAYVFTRAGTAWMQQAYLKASNTGSQDFFGWSVAVSGGTVVVGAYLEDSNAVGVNGNPADNSASGSGAAYVFTGVANKARQYLIRLAFDDPPPFTIEYASFLERLFQNVPSNNPYICIEDSVSSNLEPAGNLASTSDRTQLVADLQAIFARSSLNNVNIEVGPNDPNAYNLHVVRPNSVAVAAGLGLAEDFLRFNRKGKGNAYILWDPKIYTANQRAMMAAHEIGHLMGLPHVAAGSITGNAEIMTYDWILGASKALPGIFTNSPLNLCLNPSPTEGCTNPSAATVNCQYHLRRYVGQESDAQLFSAGLVPGSYDLETPEFCFVEAIETDLQVLASHGVNRLHVCEVVDSSLHDSGTVFRTVAKWTSAGGGSLKALVERGSRVVLLGGTQQGADVVISRNGTPAVFDDVTFDASTVGQTGGVVLAVDGAGSADVGQMPVGVSEAVIVVPNIEVSAESLNGNLVFRTENGHTYTVQQSPDLHAWTYFESVAGDGRFVSLSVPKSGFYRIVVKNP